jgi:tetratricopeptide (TPR) repeat protein
MRAIYGVLASAALVLCAPANAEQYWSYTYQGIEVTAAGNAGRAADLGHDLVQLDAAFVHSAATSIGRRPPVHVFALSDGVFKKVWGGDSSSVFVSKGPYHDIVINKDDSKAENRYWAAYFGYIAARVTAAGTHYPHWYLIGISSVFAASSIAGDRVIIGGFDRGQLELLSHAQLIPMRTFLSLKGSDPQLSDANFLQLYQAQAWLFVHQVLIEHKYRENVAKYFDLLNEGKSENEAFAASFNISYEDLDVFVRELMTKGTLRRTAYDLPRIDAAAPQLLSAAEVNARLAELGVNHEHELQDAIQRARDAISADPDNERAWRALARGQMIQGNYADALASADRLSARPSLSAQGYSDCAFVLASIAQHHTETGADAPALLQRARDDFEKALAIDGDDIASLYEFAIMIESQKDVDAAKKLEPVMEQALSRNPHDSDLARGVMKLCVVAGDMDGALKFAQVWQEYSRSDAERDYAAAYVSRLRAHIEQHSSAALDKPN